MEGTKPLRILYLERRAEVVEKLEELPEFQDKEDSDQVMQYLPFRQGINVDSDNRTPFIQRQIMVQ